MLSNNLRISASVDSKDPNIISLKQQAKARQALRKSLREIMFQSKIMSDNVRLAKRFAISNASVLITGESGTGKELFSRLIHDKSKRNQQRFIAVNCAAIAESLLESEFFGHQRGAFTGAIQQKAGYFEQADGGTLLLDEISEIPISMQAKLLRAIEEQEVQPIGASKPRPVDVRIVATSNRDLEAAVTAGDFRSDLFHRVNVVELNIPPLRERASDIPLLTMHFLKVFQDQSEKGVWQVTKEAMALLKDYQWPGNVRELRNVIHRSCIMSDAGEISADLLPQKLKSQSEAVTDSENDNADNSNIEGLNSMSMSAIERRVIMARLHKFKGDKKEAANELGVTARTLSNKLRLYHAEGFLSDAG